MKFYTYILYSEAFDRYYVGHCEHISVRLERHNQKMVSSTKPYTPWQIKYTEQFGSRAEASKREREIKNRKSRKYIEFLIQQGEKLPD
jgi:putative endonuclease